MLHVVHHVDYMAPPPTSGTFKFDKYQLVMMALRASGYPMTEYAPEPMPGEWLEAVHDPAYVAQVFAAQVPREKERRIGFPVTPHIASRVRHTNGGTWLAAQLAMRHGYAANSAAGSHHALYETGAGYCVFNDLAVTSNRLIAEGDAKRILVVDLDVHQGDGTAALTAGREDIFTFSMHAAKNFPVRKAQSDLDIELADGTDDAGYMEQLERHLPVLLDSFRARPGALSGGCRPSCERSARQASAKQYWLGAARLFRNSRGARAGRAHRQHPWWRIRARSA